MERFADEILERLAEVREIEVETVGRRTGLTRRATIWVVVDDGVPHVRSEFGDAGQWYRNAVARPRIAIAVDGRRLEVEAALVREPERWHRVSEAFRAKYRRSSSLGVMVRPEIEPMTLALAPAAQRG